MTRISSAGSLAAMTTMALMSSGFGGGGPTPRRSLRMDEAPEAFRPGQRRTPAPETYADPAHEKKQARRKKSKAARRARVKQRRRNRRK